MRHGAIETTVSRRTALRFHGRIWLLTSLETLRVRFQARSVYVVMLMAPFDSTQDISTVTLTLASMLRLRIGFCIEVFLNVHRSLTKDILGVTSQKDNNRSPQSSVTFTDALLNTAM